MNPANRGSMQGAESRQTKVCSSTIPYDNVGSLLRRLHRQLTLEDPTSRTRILTRLCELGHPLVYVPAGAFVMGRNRLWRSTDEGPQHTVTLPEYWIDMFPVTNAQFAQFVSETHYDTHGSWPSAFTPEKAQHPVVNVTWNDACAYSQWCGKRLPTEAEWEKTARGIDRRAYPWGNAWTPQKCNVSGHGTTPVGTYCEGMSPYGCHDMAGNVFEWCSDWYQKQYYPTSPLYNPQGPSSGSHRVIRGGSWDFSAKFCRTTYRYLAIASNHYRNLGMRLVASAPASSTERMGERSGIEADLR